MEAIQRHQLAGKLTLLAISNLTGFSVDELKGDSRRRPVVHARWAVILALHKRGWSQPRIGRLLGDRDHTTIGHALREGVWRKEVVGLVDQATRLP